MPAKRHLCPRCDAKKSSLPDEFFIALSGRGHPVLSSPRHRSTPSRRSRDVGSGPPPRAPAAAPWRYRPHRRRAQRSRRRQARPTQPALVRLLRCYTLEMSPHLPALSPPRLQHRKSVIPRPKLLSYALLHSPATSPPPDSTPGASTFPNDLAEAIGRRTRVECPGAEWILVGPIALDARLIFRAMEDPQGPSRSSTGAWMSTPFHGTSSLVAQARARGQPGRKSPTPRQKPLSSDPFSLHTNGLAGAHPIPWPMWLGSYGESRTRSVR
jgi:hypothetical protein